jgi:hypothetical protein
MVLNAYYFSVYKEVLSEAEWKQCICEDKTIVRFSN